MRVFPRSHWTANNPRNNSMEDHLGLSYFTSPPVGVEFCKPGKKLLYVHRNPQDVLNDLFMDSITNYPLSDANYNYAISQNTEGVYVIRGAKNKCTNSDKIRILLLLGDEEVPTDLLKKNQQDILSTPIKNELPSAPLRPGDADVHVFNLIEYLIEHKYYDARNDGVYGPLVQHAVQRLQLDLDLVSLDGVYNEWIYEKLTHNDREYITL